MKQTTHEMLSEIYDDNRKLIKQLTKEVSNVVPAKNASSNKLSDFFANLHNHTGNMTTKELLATDQKASVASLQSQVEVLKRYRD
ncbi:hypothetical protein [Robertmurraya massiliosenegalensis]|uniref:hypothetical protein n=1 Tax=Robertmurraya massiliosenegalensis TaxID=1287657 RepID=UPI00030F3B6D|nr:hypothetical protein [Robertmurraya massiliosenegalensis]